MVGVFHLPLHLHVRAAVHPLYAHSGRDAADTFPQRRAHDQARAPRLRQGAGVQLPGLRSLHRRLPDECQEGEHQGHHGISEPQHPQGQREAHRGDQRQVPALRQVLRRLPGRCGRAADAYRPALHPELWLGPGLFRHGHFRHQGVRCFRAFQGQSAVFCRLHDAADSRHQPGYGVRLPQSRSGVCFYGQGRRPVLRTAHIDGRPLRPGPPVDTQEQRDHQGQRSRYARALLPYLLQDIPRALQA